MRCDFKDLAGQTFGRLWVSFYAGLHKGRSYFYCMCKCGEMKTIQGKSLTSGHTQSCGCLQREKAIIIGTMNASHGHARKHRKTTEYLAFDGAKSRCNNPHMPNYKNYGGRGIQMKFNSFVEFFAEIGPKPSPELSLDRIKNDGNYEVGNVRWATKQQQRLNQRICRVTA